MAEPFLAQIKMFAGNFAPRGYAFCNGQLLPINQNQALFSLLGTTYGGDGRVTFALPDLRGRTPMHWDTPNWYSPKYGLGDSGGEAAVTLTASQLPSHVHELRAARTEGDRREAAGALFAAATDLTYGTQTALTQMHPQTLQPAGNSQPHNNMQPYLVVHFIIALIGIYPSRQ